MTAQSEVFSSNQSNHFTHFAILFVAISVPAGKEKKKALFGNNCTYHDVIVSRCGLSQTGRIGNMLEGRQSSCKFFKHLPGVQVRQPTGLENQNVRAYNDSVTIRPERI